MKIIEYEDKYLEDVKDLLVELLPSQATGPKASRMGTVGVCAKDAFLHCLPRVYNKSRPKAMSIFGFFPGAVASGLGIWYNGTTI